MGKNQHVTKHPDGGWQVKGAGNKIATKVFKTQHEAEDYGRKIAINQKSELITHGIDGKIRSKDSFGNDPCPPKDKEH